MNHHIEVVNSNIKYPIIFYNHFFNQNRPVTSHFHKDVEVVYIVSGKLEAYIKEISFNFVSFFISIKQS